MGGLSRKTQVGANVITESLKERQEILVECSVIRCDDGKGGMMGGREPRNAVASKREKEQRIRWFTRASRRMLDL